MMPLDLCAARDPQPRAVPRTSRSAARLLEIQPRLAFLLFSIICVLTVLSSYLGQHSDGVATIWLGNGLLFAVLMRQPRSTWPVYLLIGYLADLLGAFLVNGEPFMTSVAVSACNSLEVALAAFLLHRWFGLPFQLSRPRPLFAFLLIGVLFAPSVACALASLWLSRADGAPWGATYLTWFLGDALGMAIIAPLSFALLEPGFFRMFNRGRLRDTLLVLTVPMIAAAFDFSQSKEPLALFLLPALIFVVFRLGFPGAVTAIFLIACIIIPLTVSGHGPMVLSADSAILHKIVVVQIFLAIALFTAFPVAAMLEERRSLEHSLKRSEARFRELANTDVLTGQANRRAFNERLQSEWRKPTGPLAILSIDVDLFKLYNDLYGHIPGDDCLRRIAHIAAEILHQRSSARLYRLGGEEFAVILPTAAPGEPLAIAERIRQAVFAAHIDHTGTPSGRQTISIGVASTTPNPTGDALDLIALSDQALYAAKRNGRNRCESAPEVMHPPPSTLIQSPCPPNFA